MARAPGISRVCFLAQNEEKRRKKTDPPPSRAVELPATPEKATRLAEIQRLSNLGQAELKSLYTKRVISLEDFRDARQAELGAEVPDYMLKDYEWVCLGT